MTWDEIASKHIDHRCILRDPRTLQCVDCGHKLLLPREPKQVGYTGPPPYRHTIPPDVASPEVIARARRRAEAEIAHRKALRPTCCRRHHFEACTDGGPGCCPACPINPQETS